MPFNKVASTLLCASAFLLPFRLCAEDLSKPAVSETTIFEERDGIVAVEAEHFFQQTATEKRAFYLTSKDNTPEFKMDGDPPHVAAASNGAYLEILPDTRRNHGEKLIGGVNFCNEPGKLAVVHYKINFRNAGRYYVWVRAHSTGSEDNGLHVGLNGGWPESGRRLQWCVGKKIWFWESKQRTEKVHCGVPYQIFLDIPTPGVHTIHFSMREDGFEFDKFVMTKQREFPRPADAGPASVHSGDAPPTYEYVDGPNVAPAPAPVADNAKQTKQKTSGKNTKTKAVVDGLVIKAPQFEHSAKYYVDQGKWLAINPEKHKSAIATTKFLLPSGNYTIALRAVGENDGQSTFDVAVAGKKLDSFQCPLSKEMFKTGYKYTARWKNVRIEKDSIVSVTSTVGSADGSEFSRARWEAIVFRPADEKTKLAAASAIAKAKRDQSKSGVQETPVNDNRDRTTSPTKSVSALPQILPRQPDGSGAVSISGDHKVWHKMTFTLDGPYAHEQDNEPNPFLDYRLRCVFSSFDGTEYAVPGYFAADGDAGETSADSGTKWKVHFAPDRVGSWNYSLKLEQGKNAAIESSVTIANSLEISGSFVVAPSDKQGRDFRGKGRLKYVGKHYLQHLGSSEYFVKAGADAPETLLGYADFDGTFALKEKKVPLKTFSSHVQDWNEGDPSWQNGKGKGLIGAVNYLSGKGCNAFSFLTYNAGGDGDNVWPFIERNDKLHYDCSKLDQWGTVFDHGTAKGMYLHFKMQETENDDHRQGHQSKNAYIPTSLDGGNLGNQRKLYIRELVARFGHNLALNWNLGEENTQSLKQQLDMINYIESVDPYDHNIVIHTYPDQQDKIYGNLLGNKSALTGTSLQNSSIYRTHSDTVKWVRKSAKANQPWIVAFDESGTAAHGQCPDIGYRGFDGHDRTGKKVYDQHAVRRATLWGALLGGSAGVEYYFGYQFEENDLVCEDWRSRDQSWDYCRIALAFFQHNDIPIEDMKPSDELVGNMEHDNSKYCFAKPDEVYLVYLPNAGATELDLSSATGNFSIGWFNPRTGGELIQGPVASVAGGGKVRIDSGKSDGEDWLAVVRKAR